MVVLFLFEKIMSIESNPKIFYPLLIAEPLSLPCQGIIHRGTTDAWETCRLLHHGHRPEELVQSHGIEIVIKSSAWREPRKKMLQSLFTDSAADRGRLAARHSNLGEVIELQIKRHSKFCERIEQRIEEKFTVCHHCNLIWRNFRLIWCHPFGNTTNILLLRARDITSCPLWIHLFHIAVSL